MKSHPYNSTFLTCLAVTVVATATQAQIGDGTLITKTFRHDDYLRSYDIYVPSAYDGQEDWPLVLSFHGQVMTKVHQRQLDLVTFVADTAHFLLVYPQGLNTPQPEYPNTPGWNVHGAFGDWDDVEFVSRMIDHVAAAYRVDPSRVHATGFSHGSMMANVLACKLSDRIASIGSVGGRLPDIYHTGCPEARPISTLYIHGTGDPISPMTGYLPGAYVTIPVPETPAFWANHNKCAAEPDSLEMPDLDWHDNSTVTLLQYSGCDDNTEVRFYRVNGGGHTWPGTPGQPARAGAVNMDFHASSVIWDFLNSHPHPDPAEDYYYLDTQERVDAFPDAVTSLPHYLWIGNSADIVDLSPLSEVTSIAGDFEISGNEALAHLDGLSSLAAVGGEILIRKNPVLRNLDALSSITSLGGRLVVGENEVLEHVGGLSGLTSIDGDVEISANDALTDLDGLAAITSVGGNVTISSNRSLVSLSGLSGITSLPRDFRISRNGLNDLTGLSTLQAITGEFEISTNTSLASLDGLSSLTNVGGLTIAYNSNLATVDGLSSLVSITGSIVIHRNNTLLNLDGLSALTSVADRMRISSNRTLSACSCGLYACVASGGVAGSIQMYGNAQDGDCNADGADLVNNTCVAVGIEDASTNLPVGFSLHPAYPNPFRATTNIVYTLPEPAYVSLTIFDMLGRSIEAPISSSRLPGQYEVMFDATGLPSGVYLVQLEAGESVETRRIMVVK